jgi:hypothetical protein
MTPTVTTSGASFKALCGGAQSYTPYGYTVPRMNNATADTGQHLRFAAATGMGGCGRCRLG